MHRLPEERPDPIDGLFGDRVRMSLPKRELFRRRGERRRTDMRALTDMLVVLDRGEDRGGEVVGVDDCHEGGPFSGIDW